MPDQRDEASTIIYFDFFSVCVYQRHLRANDTFEAGSLPLRCFRTEASLRVEFEVFGGLAEAAYPS